MFIYTPREGAELEIQTPAGVLTVKVFRVRGRMKVGLAMGNQPLVYKVIKKGKTGAEVNEERQERITAGKIKRREIANQIKELRFGITQAGLEYLAHRVEVAK
jgi:hypothetical protein